jgi:hypothetical protein
VQKEIMNIQEEYERLVKLSETKEGWEKIDEAWNLACNRKKVEDYWLDRESKGPLVEGFAIDPISKKYSIGTPSNHYWAHCELYRVLSELEPNTSRIEIDGRIIKGWIGKILDFQYPCVFIASMRFFEESEFLKEIEQSILVQEIGLPLSGLFIKHLR